MRREKKIEIVEKIVEKPIVIEKPVVVEKEVRVIVIRIRLIYVNCLFVILRTGDCQRGS